MITGLTLENFKAVGHSVRLPMRRITLIFGRNSAGKSSVLQSLSFLRQIMLDPENTFGHGLTRADADIVHRREVQRHIKISVELGIEHQLMDWRKLYAMLDRQIWASDQVFDGRGLEEVYGTASYSSRNRLVRELILKDYWASEMDPELKKEMPVPKRAPWRAHVELRNQAVAPHWVAERLSVEDHKRNALTFEGFQEIKEVLQSQRGDTVFEFYRHYLFDELESLCHIGPIRKVPDFDEKLRKEALNSWYDGRAAWAHLYEKGHLPLRTSPYPESGAREVFSEVVSQWLEAPEKLDTGYRVLVEPYVELAKKGELLTSLRQGLLGEGEFLARLDELPTHQRIELVDQHLAMSLQPREVGVGVSQLLPIVVAALDWSNGYRSVMIEQPELHVHPAVAANLGDLFIISPKQFVIETHSEHLMLRLLRRIRETTEGTLDDPRLALRPEDISILYVDNPNGQLQVREMDIDAQGDFVGGWPVGFFDERSQELF